ncbi:MAG: outer membrane beta-barrel protein [Mariniphaga sp.]|nr:outer membrane beta-barrel protein [Mariniphaga sp.]
MKYRFISISQILFLALLLIGSQYDVYSQEADSTVVKPGLFVGLRFGPSQSGISNEGILSVANLVSNSQNSFGGSFEIGYFFSKSIGISSGIGFSSSKSQLELATYQNKFNTTDSENEVYERQVSGTDIKEIQNVGFLTLPVCLNIRLPLSKKMVFFIQTGINLAIPVTKKYLSSGIFTYKGYYPAYNVILQNLPAYGFPSNINSVTDGSLKTKSLNMNALVSAGFDFLIQKNIQLGIAAFYSKSLSNISDYPSPDKFQLSSDANQINSLMGGSSKASVQSIGVNVRLRYFLNFSKLMSKKN